MTEVPAAPVAPPKITQKDEESALADTVPPEFRYVSDKFKHEVLLPNLPVYRKGLDAPDSLDLVRKRIDKAHAAFLKNHKLSFKHRAYLMVLKRQFFDMIQDEALKASFENFMVPLAEKKTEEYARRNADAIAVAAKKVERLEEKKRAEAEAKPAAVADAEAKPDAEAAAAKAKADEAKITAESVSEFIARAFPLKPKQPTTKPTADPKVVGEEKPDEGFYASLSSSSSS